jgi:hypothetical protein
MAIWGCGSPAHCCQPALAGGFIYADLGSEFNTHLAPQALFTQSSSVHEAVLQAFPFPSTLGVVTLHQLSQACVFIYSSCGKWVLSPLLWSFPPSATFTSFLLLVAGRVLPLLPSPAGLLWGIPPPLQCSGHPTLFATCLFCCYCLLFSFFPFSPGWGSVCPGGYADLAQGCLWEYHMLLSSSCGLHLPKLSGCWHLEAVWEPSWFLCLTWSGDALCRLEVWRSQSFASSRWFFL